jgi:type II secretory pathway component PulK
MAPPRRVRSCPGGYALLAVLWVVAGLSILGLTVSLAGREAVAAAQNRTNLRRAAWSAEDCLERARVIIARALGPAGVDGRAAWQRLDAVLGTSDPPLVPACRMDIRAAGSALDINAADRAALVALFRSVGAWPSVADSLADAVLDWRDADDVPRRHGAEQEWYLERGRRPPRNAPFADVRELRRVRGFENWTAVDSLIGVEPGRIPLNHAPLAVLATLPGFTPEAVHRMAERRRRGEWLEDLAHLLGELSPAARDTLAAHYGAAAARATVEPEAWIVTSRWRTGSPPVTAVVEARVVRADDRAAIIRLRTWAE